MKLNIANNYSELVVCVPHLSFVLSSIVMCLFHNPAFLDFIEISARFIRVVTKFRFTNI